jgi:branched-chain amino acid transport system substrate-binding protein
MIVHASRTLGLSVLLATLTALPVAAAEPATIGIVHSEKFAYATMMKNSYDMAAEAVNRSGGVRGEPVRLVFADDKESRKGGEAAVYELAKEKGAVFLLGGYSSSNTLYTAMAANRLKIPFLVCTAADDRITQRKLRHIYRLNPPSAVYAQGLEEFLKEKVSPASMAIVYENSPYGTGTAMRMMWFCREHDIELLAIIPYLRERASRNYFEHVLSSLETKSPDVLYMVSYLKDASQLVPLVREKQYRALLCGGAGGFTHYRFIERTGEKAEGLVTAALWAPETGFQGAETYYKQYLRRFGAAPDYHGAEAYSALIVAAEALNQAADLRSESILEALDRIEMQTPFGPVQFVDYDRYQRQNRLDTLVLQIINQRYSCIWPVHLSSGGFAPPPYWRR